jgi:wobble nucleotide-excising tRNase
MQMIAKFEKITSIGKFKDFTAKGDIVFNELTLLYADNGSGKTTLASILRSLLNNDDTIIRNRISDDHVNEQAVILTTRDSSGNKITITFGKNGWKKTYDNIEIFDTFFVNENIYSGFEISDDHKKNLHHFVVGAQGVALKNKILKNKDDKEEKNKELIFIANQLISKVGSALKEDEVKPFIKIKKEETDGIDTKLKTALKELRNAQSQQTISKYKELPLVAKWASGVDFSKLTKDIQASSTTIQNKSLEKLLSNHVKELSNNSISDPEDWLRKGYDYIDHKKEHEKIDDIECPFCQQSLSTNLEIINAYTLIFNDSFNQYVERLNSLYKKVSNLNLDLLINNRDSTKKIFKERCDLWKEYLPDNIPHFFVLESSKKIKEEYDALKTLIEAKAKNPSTSKSIKAITTFQTSFDQVNLNIDNLNKKIEAYNNEIRSFKRKLKDANAAEKELLRLQRIKKRFEPEIVSLCNSYVAKFKEIKKLEDDYSQLSKDEETESNKFISDYSTKINYYLKDIFQTPFQIKDMQHGSRKGKGKNVKVDYQLLLNGKPISFDENQPFSVRDCLSEGDKSTIAFSFFLSKLEIDPKQATKILVFDDPLSSLDSNRRLTTVKLISELSKNIRQTIVLSHNEGFLWELYKDYDASKRKALRINQDFIDGDSSIEEFDIEDMVEHEYFKNIAELESWIKKPNIKDKSKVIGLIRNILESHIKFKFYTSLKHIGPSKQTFGTCIDELEKAGVIFRDNTNRKQIISMLRQLNAVSCGKHHGGTLPDPKEFGIDPSKITDTELANFVKSTFKLIEEQL